MMETIVLITGANQGLGLEMVKKLAIENESFKIVLCSRDLEKGQKAAEEVTKFASNTTVDVQQLDVSSDESIEKAMKAINEKYGRIDVLVNNAAIGVANKKTVREEMLAIYDTNVASIIVVTDAFAPLLKKSKIPRVVIMSSDLGSISNVLDPEYSHYNVDALPYQCSKAAVNMAGALYAKRLNNDGIRVNLVNPGFRSTNLTKHAEVAGKKEDGALEACRLITMGATGETATFTEIEGPIRW